MRCKQDTSAGLLMSKQCQHPPLNNRSRNKERAVLGIEPRTSRTLSENHTTRPNSQLFLSLTLFFIGFASLTRTHTIRPTRNQKMVHGATCLRMDHACDALSLKLSNIFVHICLLACHGYSHVIPAKASRVVTDGLEALCPKIMFFFLSFLIGH